MTASKKEGKKEEKEKKVRVLTAVQKAKKARSERLKKLRKDVAGTHKEINAIKAEMKRESARNKLAAAARKAGL